MRWRIAGRGRGVLVVRESLSPRAQGVWDRVVADRGVPRSATAVDAMAAYATLVARLEDARERIDRDGLVVADDKGRPIPHPALGIERSCMADLPKVTAALR